MFVCMKGIKAMLFKSYQWNCKYGLHDGDLHNRLASCFTKFIGQLIKDDNLILLAHQNACATLYNLIRNGYYFVSQINIYVGFCLLTVVIFRFALVVIPMD